MNKVSLKKYNIFYGVSAGLVFIYCFIRAIEVPLVHDEVTTFFHYIFTNDYIPFKTSTWDANNHILNSFLSSITYQLFGYSELSLRLPGLISLLLYFLFVYKLSVEVQSTFLRYAFSIALLFAHFFMEYFSLCRGYGLSMGLLFGGLYHLIQFFKRIKISNYVYAIVFMVLATLANLTLLNTLLISVFFIGLYVFLEYKAGIIKAGELTFYSIGLLFLAIAPIVFFVVYGFELKERGLLYYGGLSGFWSMTVMTLLPYFIGETLISGVVLVILFCLLVGGVVLLNRQIRGKWLMSLFSTYNVMALLLFGNIVVTLFLGYVLRTNFPEDRTGLYFYPLFVLAFFFVLDRIILEKHWVRVKYLAVPFLYFPLHFLYTLNFTHHSFWFFERISEKMYEEIIKENKKRDLPLTLGGYFSDESVWSFYNERFANNALVQSFDFQTDIADYAIYREARDQVIPPNYDTVVYDPVSKKTLIKRKVFLERELIVKEPIMEMDFLRTDEYFNFFRADSMSLFEGKHLYVLFDFEIEAPEEILPSFLVFSVNGETKEQDRYERVLLHWHKRNMSDAHVFYGIYTPKVRANSKSMVIYLWNIYKKKFKIRKGTIRIYNLSEPS